MEEEKLKLVSNSLWLELNSQLIEAGLLRMNYYVIAIISLFDRAFYTFAKGDMTERIKMYEMLLKLLNEYVKCLKEENENKREG